MIWIAFGERLGSAHLNGESQCAMAAWMASFTTRLPCGTGERAEKAPESVRRQCPTTD